MVAQVSQTVNKSLNSSSVTDASTGHFTLNYTSAFDDANYGLNSGLGDKDTDDAIQIEVDTLLDLKMVEQLTQLLHS